MIATDPVEVTTIILRAVRQLPRGKAPLTVLIDGRSGAGKTCIAQRLKGLVKAQLVHLDDAYPGWAGLASASKAVSTTILSNQKSQAGYQKWDWFNSAYGPWQPVDPHANLIVEGAGALTPETVEAARQRSGERVLTVVLEAPEKTRRIRVRNRDGNPEAWWQMWAAQENEHFARLPEPDLHIVTC
ncbi:hypothetical protein [Corynebacterium auriscanis]|uniref:hypothetical protein n=1 Tax=Corynebacterium auriscanis TaxID=99807 RepID=UPI003CF6FA87